MTASEPTAVPPTRRHRHRLPVPQRVPAKRCFTWLMAGWRMLIAYPAEWILIAVAAFTLLAIPTVLLAAIPLIGPVLPPILLVLLLGGMLTAADAQFRGLRPHFLLLLAGFRRHPGNLSLVGIFFALPLVLIHLLIFLVGGGMLVSLLGTTIGGTLSQWAASLLSMLMDLSIALGIVLLMWGLLLMAMLFAAPLIMLARVAPLDAMRLSLSVSLRNLGAIVLLAISEYMLFVLALLPAGLGFILLGFWGGIVGVVCQILGILAFIPMLAGTLHAAYKDLFLVPEESN